MFVRRLLQTHDIPDGWCVELLDNLAKRGSGHTPNKKVPEYWNGGVKWISLADSDQLDNLYISETKKEISEQGLANSSAVRYPAGIVALSRDAGVGKSAITTCEMAVSQHFIVWECHHSLNNHFLYYWLQFMKPEFERIAVGSTIKTIGLPYFERLRILCPPRQEQDQIVAILLQYSKAIALAERRIEAARQRKKGLMQRLLTGRVRFPEFVRSEDRQETKFGNLPIDWKVVPLQRLVKPTSRLEAIQPGGEIRLIGVKWYVAGAHIHSVLLGQDIKTASLSRVEENDIIYNKMWTTKAAFAVAKPEHSGAYGTTEYPQFRAKENMLLVGFLEYIFHLARFQYEATALCRGTTGRARLNPRDFLKLEIPLPSLEEQRRITTVVQTFDREIKLLTQKRNALQRQKKGLMQRLLTGRVRVNV